MNETKQEFHKAFNALPKERQNEIFAFFGLSSSMGFQLKAKREAERVIDYADRKGYGYGEVGYNLNEEVNDFAEEVPELKRQYKSLLYGYFDMLVEAKEA